MTKSTNYKNHLNITGRKSMRISNMPRIKNKNECIESCCECEIKPFCQHYPYSDSIVDKLRKIIALQKKIIKEKDNRIEELETEKKECNELLELIEEKYPGLIDNVKNSRLRIGGMNTDITITFDYEKYLEIIKHNNHCH